MLLAIDIGNTNIVFGINFDNKWEKVWRIQTDPLKTADEYEVIFRSLFINGKICRNSITDVIISSVVPTLSGEILKMAKAITNLEATLVGPDIYKSLPLKVLNPYEIGTDLIANSMAAYTKYHQDTMIIDFGTAMTFTTISKEGEILGVAIAPGLRTALKSLAGDTAQLPNVKLEAPPSVLGTNTLHAIQSGVLIGFTGLVEHMITKTEKALGKKLLVIATGGLSSILAEETNRIDHLEENITIDGLKAIGDILS